MAIKISILEDDQAQSDLLMSWLTGSEYECTHYATGQSLLDALQSQSYDVLLVDWELPDINGPEVMRQIRQDMHSDTPIIFITSRDSEEDIVTALNAGADDYLVKPVRHMEFLARLKANTRRQIKTESKDQRITFSPYIFTPSNQQIKLNEQIIELSSKEFELAYFLFSNEGKLLERKDIMSNVWQQEADLNTRTVDTHMSIIRKKLAIGPDNGWRLKSVYGHGYRLEKLDQ